MAPPCIARAGHSGLPAVDSDVLPPTQDRVRYYYLCGACLQRIEITSGPEVLGEVEAIVV